MLKIEPTTLDGRWLRLEPLEPRHEAELAAIATDPEVWQYLFTPLRTPEDVRLYLEQAFATAAGGSEIPFAQIERSTGRVIGATRIMDIRREHDAVEIGHTWLGRQWWRTMMNSESKYLLLRHLFDTLGCRRVALKTDRLNERSQRAIDRLGAVREGVLRKHMIVQGGRARDTVYYSIIDDEWPEIRARMERDLYGGINGGA